MKRRDAALGRGAATAVFALGMVSLALAKPAEARLLQIIHTNDLHSYTDVSADEPTRGGYAQVKAVIDRLKLEAEDRGIDSLTMDGGDYLEGAIGYLADHGKGVFRAIDEMGYDAVTIGNHDWLMGPEGLDEMLGDVRPRFAFLGANFRTHDRNRNVARYMQPYSAFARSGEQVAVIGLTTNEILYSWRAKEGFITHPAHEAGEVLKKIRSKYKYIIALTHLGVSEDKKMVRRNHGIDLVVGAHSHTALHKPVWEKDQKGNRIPIVQAECHAKWVGRILADLRPDGKIEILQYELVPVFRDGPKDPAMERRVADISDTLDAQYGARWLHETIGVTDSPLVRAENGPTVWGNFATETMREYAGTQLALDVAPFSGMELPAGPLTRADLFGAYPRAFDFSDRYGWNLWTVKVRGWILGLAIKIAVTQGFYFSTAGVTFDLVDKGGGKRDIENLRIGGKKLGWFKLYDLALPEGIARGAMGISRALEIILKDPRNTRVPMWLALNDKLQRVGVIREQDWQ
ncbi:MAG: bifunctional metallophosphatase/5'-nucleotidase [Bdellovibrionales bacterium]|nr:bifunctional metallophosphatase/5'-nucleotidase [Bdellovibrionales bacterium]